MLMSDRIAILGKETPKDVQFTYPLDALKKHFLALGASGSGKTVFCKALIEEATRNGIPSIIIDPQGDLASLGLFEDPEKLKDKGLPDGLPKDYSSKARVTVFTPTSSKGIPLCINPLSLPPRDIGKEESISILQHTSSALAKLLGHKLTSDDGKSAQSILYLILEEIWQDGKQISDFEELADLILNLDGLSLKKIGPFVSEDKKELKSLAKKLRYLTVGEKKLLFDFGVPTNIDVLLGLGKHAVKGKTQVSVVYLNAINSEEEKALFVATLANQLYQWMLEHPCPQVQALFYVDEISSYIPAGTANPVTKPPLQLIFKQARKYGVGCVVSTQNPGDIDYRAFAQFGTWALGRMTTEQDRNKVKDAIKSLSGKNLPKIMDALPQLKPAEFVFFSPDVYSDIKTVKTRWLASQHQTMTESGVSKITSDELREFYKPLSIGSGKARPKGHVEAKTSGKASSFPHLPLRLTSDKASEMFEASRAKRFKLFGEKTENISSAELLWMPIYRAKIKAQEKSMFGLKKKIAERIVLFDGENGAPVRFSSYGGESWSSFTHIYKLTESEINALKAIKKLSSKITSHELSRKLGCESAAANHTLTTLMEKKLMTREKVKGAYVWTPLVKMDVPALSKMESEVELSQDIENLGLNQSRVDPKISEKELSDAVRSWFGSAEIIELDVIGYPVYEAMLIGPRGQRKIRVDGFTGRTL